MTMIALALGIALGGESMAVSISKSEYKANKVGIAADYKAAKAAWASLAGNPNDICVADAKGKEKIAMADLEVSYKPTRKTHYQARVANAEANYAVAIERCDDKAGNAKDVCVKEAKAAQTIAIADAKAQMKTSDANAVAHEKSVAAHSKANDQAAEAHKDAKSDKLDAQYAVAKEKCNAFAGDAKDSCLEQAKVRFGKS